MLELPMFCCSGCSAMHGWSSPYGSISTARGSINPCKAVKLQAVTKGLLAEHGWYSLRFLFCGRTVCACSKPDPVLNWGCHAEQEHSGQHRLHKGEKSRFEALCRAVCMHRWVRRVDPA